ncbi:Putative C-5 cytosine-specific DNA methylase (plasmid) [Magnetospirillum sp. XM-1]|uniref:DNA cytosine methyltransferase n=1 Tax=Magnetospirillum sp. XM-1 TaxID=1663591 RepID=UPI00073DB9C8|nr:DNA cytosine methyltransferase [Magnetospirillum sp. XM-1]CUW41871.1 Putative C-5 cytosine-specific DNA methylase [Magnetospirillum sp. XM-1]
MLHLAYASLGDHRGRKRLWLEGRKLEDAGFAPAIRYDACIDEEAKTIRLVRKDDGSRIVSRKSKGGKDIPLIDLANAVLDRAMRNIGRVRVSYDAGTIEISVHPFDRMGAERAAKLDEIRRTRTVRTGGICTGAGILDAAVHEGLAEAGLDPSAAFAIEIDERYQDAMMRNNRAMDGACTVLGSLDEAEPELLPEASIIVAGIPCTAASLAGRAKKGAGIPERDPDVGHLIVPFLSIVKHVAPLAVILENVLPYRTTASYLMACTMLERWGYRLHETDLHGQDFGALERRSRMCLLAVDPALPSDLLDGIREGHASLEEARTMGDALNHFAPDDPAWRDISYLARKEERDLADGHGFRRQLVSPQDGSVGVIGRGYSKWRSTEPMIPHPTKPGFARLLTPAEHARCKGVDPSLLDGAAPTTAHEMLGQSVIPAAFRAVGAALGRAILKGRAAPVRQNDLPLFAGLRSHAA